MDSMKEYNLQWFMFHLLVVFSDAQFATLSTRAIFICQRSLVMRLGQIFISIPELCGFIEALHLVSQASMFAFEPEYVVQVKVRWLKLNLIYYRFILFDFLEFPHRG